MESPNRNSNPACLPISGGALLTTVIGSLSTTIKKKLAALEPVDCYFFLLRLLTILGGALYYLFTAHEYSAYEVFSWFFLLYVLYSVLIYVGVLSWPRARRSFYLITLVVDLSLISVLILFVGLFVGSFYIGFYLLAAIHSFYFGLRVGLATAVLASLFYSSIYIFLGGVSIIPWPDFIVRIGFLFMLSLSLGLISENERRQKQDLAEALKRASQAIRLKEEFLAALSHDIRTPLTSIAGYADMLLGKNFGRISSEQEAPLKRIIKGAESLLTLFNRLLELSRVKTGDIRLDVEPIDLVRLLQDMISYFRPIVPNPRVELRENLPGHPVMVRSDRTLVGHVVTNLITNALKYTEKGHVQVSLLNGASTDAVKIVVEDTGIGIKAEDFSAIFEEFNRGNAPAARSKEGTGLGLAIVQRSVQHLGGEMLVESVYGQGSKFTVTLPKASAAAQDKVL